MISLKEILWKSYFEAINTVNLAFTLIWIRIMNSFSLVYPDEIVVYNRMKFLHYLITNITKLMLPDFDKLSKSIQNFVWSISAKHENLKSTISSEKATLCNTLQTITTLYLHKEKMDIILHMPEMNMEGIPDRKIFRTFFSILLLTTINYS